jgi:hypothetical protein
MAAAHAATMEVDGAEMRTQPAAAASSTLKQSKVTTSSATSCATSSTTRHRSRVIVSLVRDLLVKVLFLT